MTAIAERSAAAPAALSDYEMACRMVPCERCGAEQHEACASANGGPHGARRLLAVERGHLDADSGAWLTREAVTARARSRPLPAIVPSPRCGWPGRCDKPAAWHEPARGARRPWGYHDVQCQIPAADPALYPECALVSGHAGACGYRRRPVGGGGGRP